jgi:hypothetical protein
MTAVVNTVPLLGLFRELINLTGISVGAILGAAAGLPVRRRIIRKWSRR